MQRVLLYAHDAVGLGHVRRVSRIAQGVARHSEEATILVLSGSSVADALPFPKNTDVLKLPSLRKVRNGTYASRHLVVDDGSVIRMRTGLIQEAVRHFEPDLVVVDKVPAGVHGELLPALRALKERRDVRIVLSLRDILDSPAEVRRGWTHDNALQTIRELYDQILVWGMREVCDIVSEYGLPADVARNVEYCGYLGPDTATDSAPKWKRPNGKRLVVATVGGGVDGGRVLSSFVRALEHTRESFASVVVMGPDLPSDVRAAIRRQITETDRPVFAIDFTRHLGRLLQASDLVVCMGGYNTLTEVISRERRAIVIPRTKPRKEQLIRALRLEELGYVRTISPEELRPERLARAIDAELADTSIPRIHRPLEFCGLDRVFRFLFPSSDGTAAVGPQRAAS